MDPSEILNVLFHFGGEFIRIGPNLDYVGGDEALSEIERDKLSLQEVIGFLKDHVEWKESMKFYFLIPGKDLANGLVFIYDDNGCVKMADYVSPGGVADVYVEYHGEEDSEHSSSGSDFENEVWELSDEEEPDVVITAAEPAESDTDVLVTDGEGVVTQVLTSPVKKKKASSSRPVGVDVNEADCTFTQCLVSQVLDPSQGQAAPVIEAEVHYLALTDGTNDRSNTDSDSDSDSESDVEYIPHSEYSGEDSEVQQLRRHARKFKKRMSDEG
jgi:hypothetical protein